MRTSVVVSGVVVFILGLIALGLGIGYSNLAAEVGGAVVTAIGIIAGGVGAALNRAKMTPRQ